MLKKLLYIGILVTVIFSLAACNQNDDISLYKIDAEDRDERNWNEESTILDIVEGKETIDMPIDRTDGENAIHEKKFEFRELWEKEESVKPFYNLCEAYKRGFLTVADIKSIAYYHHKKSEDEGFVPTPKTPEVMNAETENAIKEDAAINYRNKNPNIEKEITSEDFVILKYYGTYNDCVAVIVDYKYSTYIAVYNPITFEIAGVFFTVNPNYQIVVWKEIV